MVQTDEDLIQSFAQGDASAFDELYERHKNQLFRFCCFMMKDSSKAEDVLQKAFVRLFENLPDLAKKRDWVFKQWMFTVTANLCRDEFKKAETKRTQSLEDPDLYKSRLAHHEEHLEQKELSEKIDKAISQLPEKARQVIGLQYYADLDIRGIAGILKVPEGTVKSRLHQAKESLARKLKGLRQ